MTRHAPAPRLQRSERHQNLLLASRLARGQALGAFGELADRADGVAARIASARAWLASPLGLAVGGAVGVVVLSLAPRRVRGVRLARWGLLAWRLWHVTASLRAR